MPPGMAGPGPLVADAVALAGQLPRLLVPLHATPGTQPPPFTLRRLVTQWTFEPWLGLIWLLSLGCYLWGVLRLHRRGDRWPVSRTICWCVGGVGTGVLATFSALGAYDTVLFSIHMVQHMVLSMVTPVFFALGAPATLLLRNCGPRWHRRVLWLLHSRLARVLLWPPLPTALMCIVPFALYQTGWYEFTLRNGWAHNVLHVIFLAMGCAFFWPLLGNDPVPHRLPFPVRILCFLITMPFHSFLGTMIMGSPTLVAEEWYASFLRAWPPSPQLDQYIAGSILWATGDFIMLIVVVAIFVQWLQASQREARRMDRQLDREEERERRREASARVTAQAEYDAGNPTIDSGSSQR